VDRLDGLKIIVYSDEHPPPHFLVKCAEGSRRFQISDCKPLDSSGLEKYLRNIRKWHEKNRQVLIKAWNESTYGLPCWGISTVNGHTVGQIGGEL
jgi:hypothetical protein